jgi:hypothetical protein
MRPYLITAKLMRPSNMKRFPTPALDVASAWLPFFRGRIHFPSEHQPSFVARGRFQSALDYDGSRVSSGSIVSDYGLDDRAIGVRSPEGAKDFSSSLWVQTGSGAHPASCTMGTGGRFPGGKARPARDADHSPPSSAEVEYE